MNKTITLSITRLIATFVSVGIVGSALLVGFWSTQSTKVLDVHNDPIPVHPSEVASGTGKITLDMDYCKLSNTPGSVTVYLIGETSGQKPEIDWPPDNTAKGCGKFPLEIPIPASVQTDVYHVIFEIRYRVNPIKNSELTVFRSRSFRVINQKLEPGDAKPVP